MQHNAPETQAIVDRYTARGRYFRGAYKPEGLAAIQAWKASPMGRLHVVEYSLTPRPQERYLLVKKLFQAQLEGSILDVGSRDLSVRDHLGQRTEIVDKNIPGHPEFDWERANLPYPDQSFDTVVCLDVLEHINDLHGAFADLLRVSKKYVIISLPNCWRKMFKQMARGRGTQASYGLPPEKPMDRHKWFFNPTEIEEFLAYQSAVGASPFSIKEYAYHQPKTVPLHAVVYPIIRTFLPERYARNLLTNTAFYLLEKR